MAATATKTNNVTIYGLADPRTGTIRYVGKAVDPEVRYVQHLQPSQLAVKTKKNSWIKSLLSAGEKPELQILEEVSADEADLAERQYIAFWTRWGFLTNGTEGGTGGAVTDPEARARITAAHVGRKASDETRQKMSESHKRQLADPLARQKLSEAQKRIGNRPPVRSGEENGRAILTDEQVRKLRERSCKGEIGTILAAQYGITAVSVWQIVTGKTRLEAGGPIRESGPRHKLSKEDIIEIRRLVAEGKTQTSIAKKFGVDPSHISRLITGSRTGRKR